MKTISYCSMLFSIASFILLQAKSASSQTPHAWKKAEAAGYSYRYVTSDPTHSRFYKLQNGLTVILSPSSKEPRIQSFIAVKAGSKTDPATHTGLAHYLEHMMFKGTDRYGSADWIKEKPLLDQIDDLYERYNSTTDEVKRKAIYQTIDSVSGQAAKFAIANEYDKMMSSMGGKGTNAFTSFEETVYTDDIPSSAIDKYLALQQERFRTPILRLFHTELEAVYEEKNRTLDNDPRKVFEALFSSMFPLNNYGKQTTIGTVEHLKNPSLKEIRKYYYTYYVPNNMGVIMSGDFNPDAMIKKIDRAFGTMKSKPVPEYSYEPEKPITAPLRRDVYGPNPENVTLGFRFPGASTRDAETLNLVSEIISNGKAGLFDLDLTKKQKVLRTSAFNFDLKDYSALILQGNPLSGQSLDEVKELMIAEIKKLKSGDFSTDLVPSISNNLKRTKIESFDNYYQRASNLMSDFTTGIDWRTDLETAEKMSHTTRPDIIAFARKYFQDSNYVIVYKHKGDDKSITKVDKPHITPVEVNRNMESPFLKMVNNIPANTVKPVWLDYNKDIQRAKIGTLDVLTVRNTDDELFRFYYRYATGSWNNKMLGIAGDYLQFLGTNKMSAEDFSKAFYKLASSFRIAISGEYSTVSITGLQENFDQTLQLYEDLISNCKPDEEAWNNLKQRIKKDRENAKLNKQTIMNGLVQYAEYGPKNPFNNVLSDEELDKVKAGDLVAILHGLSLYKPVVLYYGPKTAKGIAPEIESIHKMPSAFTPYPSGEPFSKISQSANQVLFADFDMVQAEINWIRNTNSYSSAETPTVELFNNYFGTGMSSIVFQTIRESKALAYSTYAFYVTPAKKDDRYSVQAYVGTQADKLNEAIKGMNDLLTDLPESEKILASAKDNIHRSLESDRIIEDGILFDYINAKRRGVDYDIRRTTFNAVDKLDYAAVKSFHDETFKNKPYTYCIVASKNRVKLDDLKKYGALTSLDLKDIFGY